MDFLVSLINYDHLLTAPPIYTRFDSTDVCLRIGLASSDVLSQNPSMKITGDVNKITPLYFCFHLGNCYCKSCIRFVRDQGYEILYGCGCFSKTF